MGPNDAAERRVEIPTARHFGPRGIKCGSTPRLTSPMLRKVRFSLARTTG